MSTKPVALEDVGPLTPPPPIVLRIFLAVVTAPYRRAFKLYTWQPLRSIRFANGDRKALVPLVEEWREDKYNELQSVQVAASFCGGAAFSCLPWCRNGDAFWITEALWIMSLICSISAIITSIQTKSILDDLPSAQELDSDMPGGEVERMQRTILRYRKTPGVRHWVMMFIWQFPSMTMAWAWVAFLTGLTIYLCMPFIWSEPWGGRHKIAIAYLTVASVGFVTYVLSTIFVYVGERDAQHSAASTRATALATTESNASSEQSALEASPSIVAQDHAQTVSSSGGIQPEQKIWARVNTLGPGRKRKRLLF